MVIVLVLDVWLASFAMFLWNSLRVKCSGWNTRNVRMEDLLVHSILYHRILAEDIHKTFIHTDRHFMIFIFWRCDEHTNTRRPVLNSEVKCSWGAFAFFLCVFNAFTGIWFERGLKCLSAPKFNQVNLHPFFCYFGDPYIEMAFHTFLNWPL